MKEERKYSKIFNIAMLRPILLQVLWKFQKWNDQSPEDADEIANTQKY